MTAVHSISTAAAAAQRQPATSTSPTAPPSDSGNFAGVLESANPSQMIQDANGSLTSMIELQAQIQREALFYTGFSNVIKTQHDTRMNSIRNVKS